MLDDAVHQEAPAASMTLVDSDHRDPQAGDGVRTRDLWLGKPTLYQLSYTRTSYETPC
jgi:hypothetical protein